MKVPLPDTEILDFIDERKSSDTNLCSTKISSDVSPDVLRVVANITHELKTPLHSILSVTSLLKSEVDGSLSPEQKKQIEIISRNGEHLLSLITDLLSFSSSSATSRVVRIEKISLAPFLQKIVQELEPLATRKNVRIILETSKTPEYIHSDQSLLFKIVSNLLGNAIKFSKDGDDISIIAEATRDIHTREVNGLQIQVIDSGIGMDLNTKERLFSAFFQHDASNTRKYGGVGLGLSLVKAAVDKLEGNISVQSEVSQGSIFTVEIPDLKDKLIQPEILFADDDESIRESMRIILEEQSYKVRLCTISNLMNYFVEKNPDILILDIGPPEYNGLKVLSEIRFNFKEMNVPVIGMSVSDSPKARSKAFSEGVSDLIAKPFELNEFLARINVQWERLLRLKEVVR